MRILDTPPEQNLDDIAELAAHICRTPIALIALINHDRQWFKSRVGLDLRQTPRDVAHCIDVVVPDDDVFVVADALQDARFKDNPLVTAAPYIRFYAGAPLVTTEGVTLGTLCVVDRVPRVLTPDQLAGLKALRRCVIAELEQKRTLATRSTGHAVLEQTAQALARAADELQDKDQEWMPSAAQGQLVSALARHIIERKRAEKALLESEWRFRALADNIPQLAWMADDTGAFWFNQRWFDYTGTTLDEMRGWGWRKVHHPDHIDRVVEKIRLCFESIEPWEDIFPLKSADGEYRWFLARTVPVRDAAGRLLHWLGTNTDITEQREIQEELRKFKLFSDYANDEHLLVDLAGRIRYANKQACDRLGYSQAEMLQLSLADLDGLPPAAIGMLFERSKHAKIPPFEVIRRRKDGATFPVEVSGTSLEFKDEWLMLQTARDVTERKRAEAERQARLAADAANAAKSEFLANMSHELRSPLNTILGFARLMAHDPGLPAAARDDLGLIIKSGEHLYALVNQVLDLSKLETGYATYNEVDFDLPLLLEDLRRLFALAAASKGLQLLFVQRRDVPRHLRTDALKLRQILINLLDNAIKFTETGRVRLTVDMLTEGMPEPTANDVARIAFTVDDSGPGIAADELEHLFDAFVQAEAGRRHPRGTGLGLAICRGFVELMGGEITLQSEVGRGTSVRFEIPARVVAEKPVSSRAARYRPILGLAHGQPRYRILVVHHQAEARERLVRLLAPLGFEVEEAVDNEAAIEAWRRWRPHLILLDGAALALENLEAIHRIRAACEGLAVAIIAFATRVDEAARQEASAVGCDDLLPEPFREADIFAALEKHLQVHFDFEEELPPSRQPLAPHTLAALSEAQRSDLEDALVHLDIDAVERTIVAIRASAPGVAETLAAWARDFKYESILSVLRGAPPS